MEIKIVEAQKKEGNLMSITLRLVEKKDIDIYQKFLKDEPNMKACPHCGKPNTLGLDDMMIRVDSPLADRFGLKLGTPIVHCDHCGKDFDLSMVDYTAFPSVVAAINLLKKKYKEKKAGEASRG